VRRSDESLALRYCFPPFQGMPLPFCQTDHLSIRGDAREGAPHRQLTIPMEGTSMKFFDSWWQRVPGRVQAGLLGLSLVAMVLGGMAQEYWH
jgi:hypothetical protein